MNNHHYEFIKLEQNYTNEVIEVLDKNLWKTNSDMHKKTFKWKYLDNPYVEKPMGIIVLYKERVVGFKGLFVTKWNVGNENNKLNFISFADGCVDVEHRRRGLYNLMDIAALKEYGNENYGLILNTSANYNAEKACLKNGYEPIGGSSQFIKYSIRSTVNYFLIKKLNKHILKDKQEFGIFSNIEVSSLPKPEAMHMVYKRQRNNNKISLNKDIDFFSWRFNNVKKNYKFYYYWQDNEIKDYSVSISTVGNNIENIIDYSMLTEYGIKEILMHIIRSNTNSMIQIRASDFNDPFSIFINKLSFKNKEINKLTKLSRAFNKDYLGTPSMLIRPTRVHFNESDWFLSGIDARDPSNWELSDICSDAF